MISHIFCGIFENLGWNQNKFHTHYKSTLLLIEAFSLS